MCGASVNRSACRHVLEGSVRREGGKLRVTVQLIDARSGFHAWAENYDRPWSDVLAIQDDIAREVTRALKVVLDARAPPPGAVAKDLDLGAFDAYLAGLALLRQSGDAGTLKRGADHFQRALEIEPDFARAHAGLCDVGVRRYRIDARPRRSGHGRAALRPGAGTGQQPARDGKGPGRSLRRWRPLCRRKSRIRQLLLRHPGDADGAIGLGRALLGEGDKAGAEHKFPARRRNGAGLLGRLQGAGCLPVRAGQAIGSNRRRTGRSCNSHLQAPARTTTSARHCRCRAPRKRQRRSFERSLRLEPSRAAYSNLGSSYYYLGRISSAAVGTYAKATALASQDRVVWGNLADALWQIPARRDEAIATTDEQSALAERDFVQTPGDAVPLRGIGLYYAQTGEPERSLQRRRSRWSRTPRIRTCAITRLWRPSGAAN